MFIDASLQIRTLPSDWKIKGCWARGGIFVTIFGGKELITKSASIPENQTQDYSHAI